MRKKTLIKHLRPFIHAIYHLRRIEKLDLAKCRICGGIFDKEETIQENICDYNPTEDDLECWEYVCRRCNLEKKPKSRKATN